MGHAFLIELENIMSNLITTQAKRGPKPKYSSLAHQIESLSVAIPFSGCWIWMGSTAKGYGQLTFQGKHMTAHRASFIAHNPGAPAPKLVCHECDVRECVNPSHLYSGDYKTNRADMLNRDRWSHPYAERKTCFAGHDYELVGFAIAKDGSRACRECQRINKQNQRAKKEMS